MNGLQRALERFFPVTLFLWALAGVWFALVMEERALRADLARPYRAALVGVREFSERNYAIVRNDRIVGKARTVTAPCKDGGFDLGTSIEGEIFWMSGPTRVEFRSLVHVTAAYELESVRMVLKAGGVEYGLVGHSRHPAGKGGREKEIVLTFSLAGENVQTLSIPARSLALSDSLLPLPRLGKPRPGMRWTTEMVEPITGRVRTLEFRVLDKEELPGSEGKVFGYPIAMRTGDRIYTAWADEDGDILMEEVPLGFTLAREDIARLIYGERGGKTVGDEDKD